MKKAIKTVAKTIALLTLTIVAILIVSLSINEIFISDKNDYKLEDYQINIVGEVNNTVIIDNFKKLSDYSLNSEKINPNKQMFINVCELPNCFSKYYFDNDLYSSEIETDDCYCYFSAQNTEAICFGYFIEKDYERATWYIANGYQIPNIYDNQISEIMIVENAEENVIQTPTNVGVFPRVNFSNTITLDDSIIINKCKEQFQKTEYSYFENQTMQFERDSDYDFLKSSFDCNPLNEYLVLAKFDDSGIYQMLGVISNSDSSLYGSVIYSNIAKDFTWENFLNFAGQKNVYKSESYSMQDYSNYFAVYYGLSEFTLNFKILEERSDVFGYTVYSNGKAVITSYLGDESEIIFPNKIDGYDVIGINAIISDKDAFMGANFKLKKVTVEEGIQFVGPCVFEKCYRLKEVLLPKSLLLIYNGAFCDCKSLKKLSVPNNLCFVDESAFLGCKLDR